MESATTTRASRPKGLDASTLAEAFQMTAAANPDRPAIRTKDDEFTCTWARVRRAGGARGARPRRRSGLGAGQTIGLMLTNRPEFHFVDSAALHLGATPFSIYNTYTAEQIEYLVGDAANKILVTEKAFLDTIEQGDGHRDRGRGRRRRLRRRRSTLERRRGQGRRELRLRGGLEGREARRHPHAHLHLRHHRAAQGRAAHPRQPGVRGAGLRRGDPVPRRRPRDLLAALRPHRRARVQPLPAAGARVHHHRLPRPASGGGLPARGAPELVLRGAAHLGEAQGRPRGRHRGASRTPRARRL